MGIQDQIGALVSRLGQVFGVSDAGDAPVVLGSDDYAIPPSGELTARPMRAGGAQGVNIFGQQYDDSYDRQKVIADVEMIDDNVPEMARSLSIYAANSMNGEPGVEDGFALEYADETSERDREDIDRCVFERWSWQERAPKIARTLPKYGDHFGELVVDSDGTIWSLRYLDPRLTSRLHDRWGRLSSFRFDGFVTEGGQMSRQQLAPWQVIHTRFDHQEGARYGRSLFSSGRALAYRILGVRDALGYEAVNHATARNVISVGRPMRWSKPEVESWVDSLADRLARESVVDSNGNLSRRLISLLNGQDVILDFPVDDTGKGVAPTVTPLANAPLGSLTSAAEHFQDLIVAVTGVPRALLGIERGGDALGGTRLTEQVDQLARSLRALQRLVASIIVEMVRRQFILWRRPIAHDAFRVVMPNLSRVDEHVRAQIADLKMKAFHQGALAGLPPEYLWVEIAWDGDERVAADRATRYGWDARTWALRSPPASGTSATASPVEEQRELAAIVTDIRELARARKALRGAVLANRAVRFER